MTDDTTDTPTSPRRFPIDAHTSAQRSALATAEDAISENFGPHFTISDDQGALSDTYGIHSYTPETFLPHLKYAQTIVSLPYLQPNERKLATLAVASVTKAAYIEAVHRDVGIAVGLSRADVKDTVAGRMVGEIVALGKLGERERVVYEVALRMARSSGKIADAEFERAVGVLGRLGVSHLAQVVGAYLLARVVANVAQVKTP